MKLSTRCQYGTRAMIEIAKYYRHGPVKRNEIARNQNISAQYLENILISLKSRSLIRSIRGTNGGFTLERAPEHISMYEIIVALEGSIAPVHCVENSHECERLNGCAARYLWSHLHEVQVKTLKEITLKALIEIENNRQILDYSI